jgi:molybdopterin-guanine dinucleotide biosynthesis protein B
LTTARPVIGIAGWKNSGKTTLTVRLIEEFVRRGLTVATVKHTHHQAGPEHSGKDTARHRQAGAQEVALVSAAANEPSLESAIANLSPCDLVIVEGYKSAAIPKIEVRRKQSASGEALADTDFMIIAIAADHPVGDARVPVFALDDVVAIADHIERSLGLPARSSGRQHRML